MAILTKSATPGEVQLTFAHASVGKKSLGESVTALNLAESLEAPIVISIDAKIAFANGGDKIWIPVTKVLLRSAVGNLARLKKQMDWVALDYVLLLMFLMEDAILDNIMSAENILKVFTK